MQIWVPESPNEVQEGLEKFLESIRAVSELISGIERCLEGVIPFGDAQTIYRITVSETQFAFKRSKANKLLLLDPETDLVLRDCKAWVRFQYAEKLSFLYDALKNPGFICQIMKSLNHG